MNTPDNNFFGLHIDTSKLDSTAITSEQFMSDLTSNLQEVLNKTFPESYNKRVIKPEHNGLNCACPFCHDSARDERKKRGHLILQGKWSGYYKCFNCGKMMKITNFFDAFDKQLKLNDIVYLQQNVFTNQLDYTQNNVTTSSVLETDTVAQYAIDRSYLRDILGLCDISKTLTPVAYKYLTHRCQTNFHRFLYSIKYQQVIILNLIGNDKVIGMQLRDLSGKRKAKYLTMSLTKLRKSILKDETPIPDYIESLSMMFNIFNIDVHKPIMVTEGPFDAFLLPNCIATAGANKNLGIELPFWYVYDSDKTGTEHALKMLNQGYNVFMWNELKKDLNLPYRAKWDITDVCVFLRDSGYKKKVNWLKYFTSDKLSGLSL